MSLKKCFDSREATCDKPICALTSKRSKGYIRITVNRQEGEVLIAYDLEEYLKEFESEYKKPDEDEDEKPEFLLIGRAGREEPWVVIIAEVKSKSGWNKAIQQVKVPFNALKEGEKLGDQLHQECKGNLPMVRDHGIGAFIIGRLGKEFKKRYQGNRRSKEREIEVKGKKARIATPRHGTFDSVRELWIKLGIL